MTTAGCVERFWEKQAESSAFARFCGLIFCNGLENRGRI